MTKEEQDVLDAVDALNRKVAIARTASDAECAQIMREQAEQERARLAALPPPTPPTARMVELHDICARIRAVDPEARDGVLGDAFGAAQRELRGLAHLQAVELDRAREAERVAALPPRRVLPRLFGAHDDVMLVRVCEPHRSTLVVAGTAIAFPAPVGFVSAAEWPSMKVAIDDWHGVLDKRGDTSRLALPLFGEDRFDVRKVAALAGETVESSIGFALGHYLERFVDLRVLVKMAARADGAAIPPRGYQPASALAKNVFSRAHWIAAQHVSHGSALGAYRSEVGTVVEAIAFWHLPAPAPSVAETTTDDGHAVRRPRAKSAAVAS